MGFGGAALAANQQIRNNRNLLKSKRKIGELSFVSSSNTKWSDPKKASFEQLMEIRRRLRRERKVNSQKLALVTLILIGIIIAFYILIDWNSLFHLDQLF